MKRLVVVGLDIMMAVFAMWLAFSFRLDTPHWPEGSQWALYALAPALAVPIFVKFGLYRAIFRYTGLAALVTTAQAVIVYGIALFVLILTMQHRGMVGLPRTTGILQPLIFLLMVGCSRAIARFWLAGLAGKNRRAAGRLLIYGAGSAGAQTASAIGNAAQYALMGFLDDDPAKSGRTINGVPVFLPTDAHSLVKRLGITDILLALPSARRERRNQILQSLYSLPVHVRTLPGLADLASGRVSVQDFRELEIEDLLGRDPVTPDTTLLSHELMGEVVLVTGAGGSIGSELCRQILKENPQRLLLVDQNEFGLYSIHQELIALCDRNQLVTTITALLGSVTNHRRMDEICRAYRPSIVYHAAAYKHVPMVEQNPAEGIANNVFGTLSLARAAMENQVAQFVLISTDKAVRPTNLMGASKRVAELILQALANSTSVEFPALGEGQTNKARLSCGQTRFVMVRFGNVLGSSGSVVPLFRKQLELGGPLTVTHPEVTRYFMTVSEAVQLVLQAGIMAEGGEVFVLDMGEPVRIVDLAKRMIALSGLTLRDDAHPHGDIEVVFSGLRPGEKLFEELLIGENPLPTSHPRIMRAREDFVAWRELVATLSELDQAVRSNDVVAMKGLLRGLVSGAQLTEKTFDHISLAREFLGGESNGNLDSIPNNPN
jgi:FlaA1/EpsC-like NDP-sugar epimerase